jgi:hypothetical protein
MNDQWKNEKCGNCFFNVDGLCRIDPPASQNPYFYNLKEIVGKGADKGSELIQERTNNAASTVLREGGKLAGFLHSKLRKTISETAYPCVREDTPACSHWHLQPIGEDE